MERTIISSLSRSFVTIVDKGSITAAAVELGMAKSAISQNLKQLEHQLGVKLAIRTTRRFNLTPAGQRYYNRCKEILSLAQLASNEMENYGATPSGPLRITAPHAMITPIVAPALSHLLSEYPLIKPIIVADDRRLDLIANALDLSITVGALADSTLKAMKVGTMHDVLCISQRLVDDRKLDMGPNCVSEVQGLPYIRHMREPSHSTEIVLKSKTNTKPITVRLNPALTGNTVEALLAMTRQGLGIALLPSFAVEQSIRSGTLIELFPHHHIDEKDIHAVHAYHTHVPTSVRRLVELVKLQITRLSN